MICPLLMGQLSINGTIRPSIMYNISDQEQMYLPFRIAQLRMGNTIGSFDFFSSIGYVVLNANIFIIYIPP